MCVRVCVCVCACVFVCVCVCKCARGRRGPPERDFFIDNLLVRVHWIIEMIVVDPPCAMEVRIPDFQVALYLPSQSGARQGGQVGPTRVPEGPLEGHPEPLYPKP